MSLFSKKRIYLDYAAATPVRPEVRRVMEKYFSDEFANPSAVYEEGIRARAALEGARAAIAHIVHAGSRDVIFTSGGTESDNLAIFGVLEEAKKKVANPHIIVTEHDHPAILEAARKAERQGAELSIVPVKEVLSNIQENTVLISLSLCNSETGELLPVSKIGRTIRELRKKNGTEYPYLHIDASQAVVTQHINVDTLQADLLTLDAGKVYGPKGAGLLVVRPWAHIAPQLVGGGQEKGLRSGTENVAHSVGFAEALRLVDEEREVESIRMKDLREKFVIALGDGVPDAIVNGENTVPNILSMTLPGRLHEFIAIALAERGILISTGSSCSSRKDEGEKEAVRFSFGRETSHKDIECAIRALKEILI